jgi:hypothetical protein
MVCIKGRAEQKIIRRGVVNLDGTVVFCPVVREHLDGFFVSEEGGALVVEFEGHAKKVLQASIPERFTRGEKTRG